MLCICSDSNSIKGYAEFFSTELSEKVIRDLSENALKCKCLIKKQREKVCLLTEQDNGGIALETIEFLPILMMINS